MPSSRPPSGYATPTTSSRRASEDGPSSYGDRKRDERAAGDGAGDGYDSDDEELRAAEAHVGGEEAGDAEERVGMLSARGGEQAASKSYAAHSASHALPYRLSTSERARGLANRILFSRYYIIFYLVMTGLSLATVVLSLKEGDCPGTAWHVLEIVVNGGMVLEVGTRWVGFGKQYPMTLLNIVDLLLTAFCVITLMVVFFSSCGGSKREEVLDTILLVVRNGVQFWRLGTILRRSGHSLLHAPKPIDLSQARAAAMDLDLNLDDDEALAAHHLGSGIRRGGQDGGIRAVEEGSARTYFDAADEVENADARRTSVALERREGDGAAPRQAVIGPDASKGQTGYNAGRGNLTEEDEAAWDRMS